jgi:imidazolonepropionase-like amidohydrolase
MTWRVRWRVGVLGILLSAYGAVTGFAQFDETRPVDGLRDNLPRVYALVGARIVVAPGRVIECGNLVVRKGVIEAIGPDVVVPDDATRWDVVGKTIYPGLIDAYGETSMGEDDANGGAGYWSPQVQPQRSIAERISIDAEQNQAFRSQGVTVRLVAPRGGIVKGQSALLTTGVGEVSRALLRARVALHLRLAAPRQRARDQFPNSPMGAVALARQAVYDALWYRDAWQVFQTQSGAPRPEQNAALEALQPFVDQQRLVIIDTADEQYLLRADRFAREFNLRAALVGSGHEYRRLQDVVATGRPINVPVDFPEPPDVSSPEAAADVSLEQLMHWDHAPENPARLHAAGVQIALTSHGLESGDSFLSAVRVAVRRGLSPDDALRAITEFPARLLEIDRWVGSLEPGKLAHFVLTDGPLFDKPTRVLETWVDGTRFVIESVPPVDLRGTWRMNVQGREQTPDLVVSGELKRPRAVWQAASTEAADDAPSSEPLEHVQVEDSLLSARFDAKAWHAGDGVILLSATFTPGSDERAQLIGRVTFPDGTARDLAGRRVEGVESGDPESASTASVEDDTEHDEAEEAEAEEAEAESDEAEEDEPDEDEPDEDEPDEGEASEDEDEVAEDEGEPEETEVQAASFAVNYPLGAFGVAAIPEQAEWVVFRQATVWTCGPDGKLDRADVLVNRGRIDRIASSIDEVPAGTLTIDAAGRHLTPGIIDCHSHMATDGGINEGTQAITAEVRVGDFIDARDVSIYRQLAGGVTTANLLHGSANPIGGQNQVIKLRWGATGEAMKFAEAPAGIKFALGENVKQSNWGDEYRRRYPQSRMGVEQIIRDAFLSARQYRHRQRTWQSTRQGLPPRFDLELEALAEIQEGQRWIHCHSYRQDEILALLRTLESFGIQVGTLQHVLEGYKVAEAMQRHGAMASSFSDWWAYKMEVFDAIPFNGALMHEAGIVVSFNSDDHELARHLNHEAAKAVKYGGVAREEALKFVTLNPARQLRIEEYVGSIEVGKHADLVLWSGSPLSVTSRCEQTWIDGRKYFDLQDDRAARPKWQSMRAELVQKILKSGQTMQDDDEAEPEERDLWPRVDIYCHLHDHGAP